LPDDRTLTDYPLIFAVAADRDDTSRNTSEVSVNGSRPPSTDVPFGADLGRPRWDVLSWRSVLKGNGKAVCVGETSYDRSMAGTE
jgi:hypothetical protein